jgi:hypothetical protein
MDGIKGREEALRFVDEGLRQNLERSGRELSQKARHHVPRQVARRVRKDVEWNENPRHAINRLSCWCDRFHVSLSKEAVFTIRPSVFLGIIELGKSKKHRSLFGFGHRGIHRCLGAGGAPTTSPRLICASMSD